MYTHASINLSYVMGHFFVFMQLYSWAAVEKGAMNKFVEEDWARIFCNVVVGVQFIVGGFFMTLFPNLRCPHHRFPEIGNVPYIHNIILSFVSATYYYIRTKCTSDGVDRAYLVLSAYGIMWFTMAYLMKWLLRWRFMKCFQYMCPQVVLPVSGEKKTKEHDLEMGVKENVRQDGAVDQDGAVERRELWTGESCRM